MYILLQKSLYVNMPFNRPVHKFTNETDKTAHAYILCFTMPTGVEKMFVEIGKPVAG